MAEAGGVFDDGKDAGAMRTIGEVSAAFGIKPHVLRYWEQQFPMLEPLKRSGGRRLYRAEDLELVETIDRLVNREGYTLKGAKMAIQQRIAAGEAKEPLQSAPTPVAPVQIPESHAQAQDPAVARQLRAIRDRLAAAIAA